MSDQQQPEPESTEAEQAAPHVEAASTTAERPATAAPKGTGRRRPGAATFAVAAAASGFAFGAVVFGMARGEAEGSDDDGRAPRIVRIDDDEGYGRGLLREPGDDEYEEWMRDQLERRRNHDDEAHEEHEEHEDEEHEYDDEHEDAEHGYEEWMRHELEEGEGEWWQYERGGRTGDDVGYYEPHTSTRGS